jgi:hypothetical protein
LYAGARIERGRVYVDYYASKNVIVEQLPER